MDFFRANKSTIAFLPLDLDYQLPDEDAIIHYCKNNHIPQEDTVSYAPAWEITPICGRFDPQEWWDPAVNKIRWTERYVPDLGPLQYVNNIDKKFPELIYMLDQLPYRELSVATIFRQKIDVTCHIDWFDTDKDNDLAEMSIENEPRRFNINLSKHDYKSFFVSDSEHGKKHYCNITKEVPGYAITEKYNWHGADYVGEDKLILVTAGLIDRCHRDELVERSIAKFSDSLIKFG